MSLPKTERERVEIPSGEGLFEISLKRRSRYTTLRAVPSLIQHQRSIAERTFIVLIWAYLLEFFS